MILCLFFLSFLRKQESKIDISIPKRTNKKYERPIIKNEIKRQSRTLWENLAPEEAGGVIKILLECDGGCEYCVAHLLNLFCKEFPDYEQIAKNAFKKKFGKELDFEPEKQRKSRVISAATLNTTKEKRSRRNDKRITHDA